MPAAYKVNEDRLNVEVWPSTNRNDGGTADAPVGTLGTVPTWSAAVGYGSDLFRLGYFTKPATALMGNGSGTWQEQATP